MAANDNSAYAAQIALTEVTLENNLIELSILQLMDERMNEAFGVQIQSNDLINNHERLEILHSIIEDCRELLSELERLQSMTQ